ncbi:DUF5991 domain-containing protein [Teredinibacter turnerae]|uniref:DUF5991 domain-containing protein n=1 Tax=Teredinibacter turnerae TaxID=2426 RepID=UPI0003658FD0|nr:DUF5991 domain-containing protein [Teredinibacter turnerae]
MKINWKIFFLLSLILVSCAKAGWEGNYFCELEQGEAAPGQAVVVEHELTLGKSSCQLTVNGFQVAEDIVCKYEAIENGIRIQFVSYSNGSTKNRYGIEVYKPLETLFDLHGNQDTPVTQWASLHAEELKGQSSDCFKKE